MHNYFTLLCCIIGIGLETTHYERLEVSPTASQQQIRKAYHRKALALHPDKNPAPDANRLFQELQQAHEILKDPELREEYDRSIEYPEIKCYSPFTGCTDASWLEQ